MHQRRLVGVAVDGVSTHGRSVLRGVMRYANLQRRWVLHKDLWHLPETLARFPRCDGAIVAGLTVPQVALVQQRCEHLVVCAGGSDPNVAPVVALDDDAVGALAGQHLLDCRLRHFGFYGVGKGTSVADTRRAGFVRKVVTAGFTCEVAPVPWPSGVEWLTHAHRPALMAWLHTLPKPVGILAADDLAAHDLAEACLEADIDVPDAVAIVGVNNDDLLCEGAWPPLSSVEADYARVGYHAAKVLDRLFAGDVLTPAERLTRLPPLGVEQRASTGMLAVDDANLTEAVRYIRAHACDPCTVRDVLRHVPVARRWLERQFVAQLGRTPHDEITHVRIETAKRLLMHPDLSLADVTARCGFAGIQNLSRAFRQVTSTTPAAYRRAALHHQATTEA